MEIKHIEVRHVDNLDLLKEYMCDDAISIVNDYLDNKVVSFKTVVKYNNFKFEYSRKVYSKWIPRLYNQTSSRRKQCVKDILKILFEHQGKAFFRKQLSSKIENYCYQYICGTVNMMISNGLCRFKLKTVRFDTYDEDEPYEYKSIRCVYIPQLEQMECDSEDELLMG